MDLAKYLSDSLSYPSGDNCQPFQFQINGTGIFTIIHSNVKASHRMNLSNTASILSFGCLLETLSLNATVLGMKVDFELKNGAFQSTESAVWAVATLSKSTAPASARDILLQKALSERATHRGPYNIEPINEADLESLSQEAFSNADVRFAFNDRLSPKLEQLLLSVEEEAWKDIHLAKALLKSIDLQLIPPRKQEMD